MYVQRYDLMLTVQDKISSRTIPVLQEMIDEFQNLKSLSGVDDATVNGEVGRPSPSRPIDPCEDGDDSVSCHISSTTCSNDGAPSTSTCSWPTTVGEDFSSMSSLDLLRNVDRVVRASKFGDEVDYGKMMIRFRDAVDDEGCRRCSCSGNSLVSSPVTRDTSETSTAQVQHHNDDVLLEDNGATTDVVPTKNDVTSIVRRNDVTAREYRDDVVTPRYRPHFYGARLWFPLQSVVVVVASTSQDDSKGRITVVEDERPMEVVSKGCRLETTTKTEVRNHRRRTTERTRLRKLDGDAKLGKDENKNGVANGSVPRIQYRQHQQLCRRFLAEQHKPFGILTSLNERPCRLPLQNRRPEDRDYRDDLHDHRCRRPRRRHHYCHRESREISRDRKQIESLCSRLAFEKLIGVPAEATPAKNYGNGTVETSSSPKVRRNGVVDPPCMWKLRRSVVPRRTLRLADDATDADVPSETINAKRRSDAIRSRSTGGSGGSRGSGGSNGRGGAGRWNAGSVCVDGSVDGSEIVETEQPAAPPSSPSDSTFGRTSRYPSSNGNTRTPSTSSSACGSARRSQTGSRE